MRETIRIGLLGLALIGGTSLVAGVLTAPSAVLADAIDDQIKELTSLAKKAKDGEEGPVIAKMNELGDNPDKRITKMFASLCKNKRTKIASLAMKKGAKRKDRGVLKTLKSVVKNKKVAKNDPDRLIAALEAIGMYEDKSTLDALEDVIKKYLPTNSMYSVPAIEAFGSVQEKDVIEQLLKWLDQTSVGSNSGSGGGGGGGGGGSISSETRDNYAKASNAIMSKLTDLTHMEYGDAKGWRDWWDEEEKGFEFKEAPVEEEIDHATLTEYKDVAYGFSVAKPDAPTVKAEGVAGWVFSDSERKDVRVVGAYRDDKDYQLSDIQFLIWNTSSAKIKTPKALADYYVQDWKDDAFSEFSLEPTIEEMKIDGREWLMARAKGMAGGKSRGWGAMEYRIYITKQDHILIYVAARWRLGAEDEIQKQCVQFCEAVRFEKKGKKKR